MDAEKFEQIFVRNFEKNKKLNCSTLKSQLNGLKFGIMPTYLVVQCYKSECGMFQCQQEKKINKFSCVVCGEKQSVRKIYATSYQGKDVREIVMQLNMTKDNGQTPLEELKEYDFDERSVDEQKEVCALIEARPSAWAAFVQEANEFETLDADDSCFVLENPAQSSNKRKRLKCVSKLSSRRGDVSVSENFNNDDDDGIEGRDKHFKRGKLAKVSLATKLPNSSRSFINTSTFPPSTTTGIGKSSSYGKILQNNNSPDNPSNDLAQTTSKNRDDDHFQRYLEASLPRGGSDPCQQSVDFNAPRGGDNAIAVSAISRHKTGSSSVKSSSTALAILQELWAGEREPDRKISKYRTQQILTPDQDEPTTLSPSWVAEPNIVERLSRSVSKSSEGDFFQQSLNVSSTVANERNPVNDCSTPTKAGALWVATSYMKSSMPLASCSFTAVTSKIIINQIFNLCYFK
jgi:hypothetical protein